MDEARARGAPQLGQYVDPATGGAAAPSRGRAALRWVGIGSCVLVVGMLLASWLMWPQTAQLFGRWLAAEDSGTAARGAPVLPGSPPASARARANG